MAQVNVIGRITADLELKTSEKSNPYVRFDIAENIGSRQTLHTQYFQVCAWGEDANRLMKAHAKKGSLIWVTGSLELEPYTKRDGISIDKRMKILLDNWGFVPVGRVGASKQEPTPPDPKIPPKQEYDGIDGERHQCPSLSFRRSERISSDSAMHNSDCGRIVFSSASAHRRSASV